MSYTFDEFAAICREECPNLAQGYDDGLAEPRTCGEQFDLNGEMVTVFCGRHWGPVLGAMEQGQ